MAVVTSLDPIPSILKILGSYHTIGLYRIKKALWESIFPRINFGLLTEFV